MPALYCGGRQVRERFSGALAAALAACAPLTLAACAAADSYAGIALTPGAGDAELQDLARRAQAGDKQAQLELGMRYEEGRGLPPDLKRAERLYRLAARDTGGPQLVYVPAAGKGTRASTVPIDKGPLSRGLAEAGVRLARLRAVAAPRSQKLKMTNVRTIRGRLFTLDDSDDQVCAILRPAFAQEYQTPVEDCTEFVFDFVPEGENHSRRVYGLAIVFSAGATELISEAIGLYLPEESYMVPLGEPGIPICGTFKFHDLKVGSARFTVILGPIDREGHIDYDFRGPCGNGGVNQRLSD